VLAAELPAASTSTSKIVRAHLLVRSIVSSFHLHFTTVALTILICIPGCFKLNYLGFTSSVLKNNNNTSVMKQCE